MTNQHNNFKYLQLVVVVVLTSAPSFFVFEFVNDAIHP